LNFFRSSREHGVREEKALEEEETSDVEEVGVQVCRSAAAMSDISTMSVL
jgi:hypothetical protein